MKNYSIFVQNFQSELEKIAQFEFPAFAISRAVKPYLTSHPRNTEQVRKLENKIEEILKEYEITDYKVSAGKRIPEKEKVMKAFHFDWLGKVIGKEKAEKYFDKTIPYRDWTLANPKIIHVGTNDPTAAAHEIGHAIQYSKYPRISKSLFGVAETAAAVPALMASLSYIPKLKGKKIFQPFIKRPFLASALFGIPLLGRETYANIKALQLAPKEKRKEIFWKKVLPLQAAYTSVILSPAILATLFRRLFR